jgi:hypothetical protein
MRAFQHTVKRSDFPFDKRCVPMRSLQARQRCGIAKARTTE